MFRPSTGKSSYFQRLLDQVESHSTVVGRVWTTSLFVFRVVALAAGASLVWWDDQSLFVCNTQHPGCVNECFNSAFPISLLRFWIMQVMFVSAPTLVHVVYAIFTIRQEDAKKKNIVKEKEPVLVEMTEPLAKKDEGESTMRIKTFQPPLSHYLVRMCFKIILELAFVICQCVLVGVVVDPLIQCPCHMSVDCSVPRAFEKTIFSIFMVVLACLALLLNVADVINSLCARKGAKQTKRQSITLPECQPAEPVIDQS